MFSIVQHNSLGTVYGFIRRFSTIEAAEEYRKHHGEYVEWDAPIIHEHAEPIIVAVNKRHSPISARHYLMSSCLLEQYRAQIARCIADAEKLARSEMLVP